MPPATHAQATPPFVCPLDRFAYPEKCEKLARRSERALEREERAAEIESYRSEHPWRISAVAESDLFMLGLGNNYVAGFWGVALGVSMLREVMPAWTVRVDTLGRFGHGHLSDWNIDNPGPIDTSAGYFGGAEVHASLLRRMRMIYFGPALSLGLFHLRDQTLHESDFEGEYGSSDGNTVRVPHDAAFLAGGFVLGGELTPGGQFGINLHFMPGLWNDFRHLYVDVALALTVKLWD